MLRHLLTPMILLTLSCSQISSPEEKEYIKNLEEKNKLLEEEINELKVKTKPDHPHPVNTFKMSSKKSTDFFTIGSTEDEVLKVMGEPSSYMITAPEARRYDYGLSAVYFFEGKVISYDNLEGNLKVKVKK